MKLRITTDLNQFGLHNVITTLMYMFPKEQCNPTQALVESFDKFNIEV